MIKVFQTGILPLGHFDVTDADLATIEGGEVLVFDEAPVVAGERAVPDVYQNGARSNLRLATENDHGPFFFAGMDKVSGQFSTPGFERTSAFSVNTAFAQEYDSSSKVSIFAAEGFYSISSEMFEDGYVTEDTPVNTRLYVGPGGHLTTRPSNSAALVGYFIEFRKEEILNNNINRPYYTAGTQREGDTIIVYKTNADGYMDMGVLSTEVAQRISLDVVSVSAAYTALPTDNVILADGYTAAFDVTIPLASASAGKKFDIKKTDSSANAITVQSSGSDTFDGLSTLSLTTQYDSVGIVSDGSAWYIISSV